LLKVKNLRVTFSKYRPFLAFLGRFFLVYLVLAGLYQFYLSRYDAPAQVDPITVAVADQSVWVLELLGVDAASEPHSSQPCMKLIYEGTFVARIIEGCNAISVMILFAAFVVAFSGRMRDTLWFLLAGSAVIYILNIVRISSLASALYHFPEYESALHGVLFPFIIYSVTFVLWVIWVNRYSYVKNPARK
jgi:exosortase family protein XrtF